MRNAPKMRLGDIHFMINVVNLDVILKIIIFEVYKIVSIYI